MKALSDNGIVYGIFCREPEVYWTVSHDPEIIQLFKARHRSLDVVQGICYEEAYERLRQRSNELGIEVPGLNPPPIMKTIKRE